MMSEKNTAVKVDIYYKRSNCCIAIGGNTI
jgi:hypothetical protein